MLQHGRKRTVGPQVRLPLRASQGPSARGLHNRWVCVVDLRLEQRLDAHGLCRLRSGDRAGAGFLLLDRDAGLREFFWISLFFLLTTPLLQFASIHMDHYNFHTIADLAGTQMPYMLALLTNLVIAGAAGLMFQLLWRWQYSGDSGESSALRRASWVALPPVISVYCIVVVITNISISVQLAILLPVLAAVLPHCRSCATRLSTPASATGCSCYRQRRYWQ